MRSLLLPLLFSFGLAAAPVYRLEWRDLAPLAQGRKVTVRLHDGIRIKGTASRFEEKALTLVRPQGDMTLARSLIAGMDVGRPRHRTWRIVGPLILGGIGMLVGIPVWEAAEERAIAVAIIGGTAALGYLAGHVADDRGIRIELVERREAKDVSP